MLSIAALLFGEAAWMRTKAAVASVLIERSLERTLADGRPRPPWAWADFHPVARLRVPRLGLEQPILSGATGATLAFGLGQVPGTGSSRVIAGHRDTWAAFLRDLRTGDQVILEGRDGERTYRVTDIRVVAPEAIEVLSPDTKDRLTLVTCWPFSGLARARLRVLVSCTPVQAASTRRPRRR
jgi:sortase A